MATPAASVRAGRVGAPHGLDGSVRIAEAVPALLRVGMEVESEGRVLRIVRRAGTDSRPIIRFDGCSDRDSAERMRGSILTVAREKVPELGEDEWWSTDLIGCTVTDSGVVVGEVTGVLGLPSCEVLEVDRPGLPALLVPLVDDAVREVDLGRSVIEIDLRFLGEEAKGGAEQ